MKRIISIILLVTCVFSFTACKKKGESTSGEGESMSNVVVKLETPTNVSCDDNGLITWTAVTNATSYDVTFNGVVYSVTTTSYQASSIINDFTYSIVAKAEGYESSDPTKTYTFTGTGIEIPELPQNLTVKISGSSEVRMGNMITLTAKVTGEDLEDTSVEWSIIEGSEYAVISSSGVLMGRDVTKNQKVVVQAKSKANGEYVATKAITVLAKPTLTQEMLDVLANDTISFEGYISISLYTMGQFSKLDDTYDTTIKTAMNGINWYAEYYNGSTGLNQGVYYKNHNGVACQVGVNFLNQEEYYPLTDDFGNDMSWQDSYLYNSLKNLSVSDFKLNKTTWHFDYVGNDAKLAEKVIASANPYDFVPKGFSLMVDGGDVLGIYSMSEDDYSIQQNYRAVQELYAFINLGDDVDVPSVNKFPTFDEHAPLAQAIANMQALESYTVDFYQESQASGISLSEGFTETITSTDCYFRPYDPVDIVGNEVIKDYREGEEYGYKKISDSLYNSYFINEMGEYQASRAYETSFEHAKPTFALAAEIFTAYYENEDGSITYYIEDQTMMPACSTLYYGVGNDINLYGIFAYDYFYGIAPQVTVKDGYIVEVMFEFFLGSILGVALITYDDFNTATMPEGVNVEFETRYVPTSWSQVDIIKTGDINGGNTADDEYVNAVDYLVEFFDDEDIAEKLPFFGNVLGDCYGFAMETTRITATGAGIQAIQFYYDVPLDVDYTINESINKVCDYLISLGFTANGAGEYTKGNIVVLPYDSDLDFMIYVWKV